MPFLQKLFMEKQSRSSNFWKIPHPINSHASRGRISEHARRKESACSKVSLDPAGCFNLRRYISGDHGGKVAFYQGSHD
jgi:hypothetical protein